MREVIWKRFGSSNYSVSNTGLVRSDITLNLLSGGIDSGGYRFVNLRIDGLTKSFSVHILVAIVFKGFVPSGKEFVIHHDDEDKLNNHEDNLKIVTFRANCSIERTAKSSSIYTGVVWCKREEKWLSRIRIKGKLKHLGYFINELDAHDAYQNALKKSLTG